MLKVVNGIPPKPKPDYESLYLEALAKSMTQYKKSNRRDVLKRVIFYGVKYIKSLEVKEQNVEGSIHATNLIQFIKKCIGKLSPAELIMLFPVIKDFDGGKYGCKDYFFTMNVLRNFGMKKKIGEEVEEILWDYMNHDLSALTCKHLGLVDNIRRAEGQPSIMSAFAEEFGIPTYSDGIDRKGRKVMVNNDTGEESVIVKKRPRYLRVVKNVNGERK